MSKAHWNSRSKTFASFFNFSYLWKSLSTKDDLERFVGRERTSRNRMFNRFEFLKLKWNILKRKKFLKLTLMELSRKFIESEKYVTKNGINKGINLGEKYKLWTKTFESI